MNNLTLSCLALGAAGVLWLGQRNSVEAARANQRVLQQELTAARQTLAETDASVSSAQDQFALRRQELDGARNKITAAAIASQPTTLVPPDPPREGFWPKDKPYCYLSKQHLRTIGFTPFTADTGITSEAATLFGMSAAERAAVDNAYREFVDRTRELHLAHVQLVETNAAVNTDNHREITYRIPALTNEFRGLRGAFATSLEQTLGKSRADVFFKSAKTQIDNIYGQFGNDGYTIKYYADRNADGTAEHQLSIQQRDGRASNGYRVRFPIDSSSALWKYRHLIGDQPLLE